MPCALNQHQISCIKVSTVLILVASMMIAVILVIGLSREGKSRAERLSGIDDGLVEDEDGVEEAHEDERKDNKAGAPLKGSAKGTKVSSSTAGKTQKSKNPTHKAVPKKSNHDPGSLTGPAYKVGNRVVYLEGQNRQNFPVKTLVKGQVQSFKALRASCKKSGKLFEDPEFNPKTMDLIGEVDLMSDAADYPKWNKKFVWKRPKEVQSEVVFSKADPDGRRYTHSNVLQGKLGDCYYLTAIGLVTINQNLANYIIPMDNNDEAEYCGIYHFRFWIRGYNYDVVIDDRIPYMDTNGKGKLVPAFTKVGGNQIWPMLMEKAYAKLYGSYQAIEGGVISEALEDMTGGLIETSILSAGPLNFYILNGTQAMGTFVGFGTPEKASDGLVDGHAYGLIDLAVVIDDKKEMFGLLRLRNPWGHTEYTGDWSDKSERWKTIPPAEAKRLNTVRDEGEFWIELYKINVFERAYFCYWHRDLEKSIDEENQPLVWQEIHSSWKGEGTQDIKSWEGIAKRPQFKIDIKKEGLSAEKTPAILLISLMYKNYIERRESIPTINFRLFEIVDKNLLGLSSPFSAEDFKKKKLKRVELLQAVKTAKTREYCTGTTLQDGSYVIIPYAEAREEGEFLLRIISDGMKKTPGKMNSVSKNLPSYAEFSG